MQMMRHMGSGGTGMNGMMPGMSGSGGSGSRSSRIPEHVKEMIAKARAGSEGHPNHALGAKRLNLLVDDGGHRIPEIVKLVDGAGVILDSVELHKPTLDDVFLSVTGRSIRDERGSFIEDIRRQRIVRQARGQRVLG